MGRLSSYEEGKWFLLWLLDSLEFNDSTEDMEYMEKDSFGSFGSVEIIVSHTQSYQSASWEMRKYRNNLAK